MCHHGGRVGGPVGMRNRVETMGHVGTVPPTSGRQFAHRHHPGRINFPAVDQLVKRGTVPELLADLPVQGT